jgi:hypothetical protein
VAGPVDLALFLAMVMKFINGVNGVLLLNLEYKLMHLLFENYNLLEIEGFLSQCFHRRWLSWSVGLKDK